ncbi:MAG TPA: helix-turn-helix domain-containing protein [Rubrobacteraceae bacterium]|nr:helix-turn-helix domain-containing protein [Rubrobacteraceae bacterium]
MHGSLSTKLRILRVERGLTLRDAEQLTGVDKDTLSKIERGRRHPHDVTLAKIAQGYDVPVEELLEEPVAPLGEASFAPSEEREARMRALRESQAYKDAIRSGFADHNIAGLYHFAEKVEFDLARDAEDLKAISLLEAALISYLRSYEKYERHSLKARCTPAQLATLEDVEERLLKARDAVHAAFRACIDRERQAAEGDPAKMGEIDAFLASIGSEVGS